MSRDPSDWERQRTFLAVLREGSLSAASRALGVAQPTVRRRIEELERQLGVALFVRSPQGLTPTAMALRLEQPALAMAHAADAFGRAASAEAEEAAGVVRVAASEVIGVEVLPPVLASLRASHPRLVVELSLGSRSEDLLRGETDIAVRMVDPVQKALVARRIGRIEIGFYGRRDYIEARGGPPTSVADLPRFDLIGFQTETVGVRTLRAQGLRLQTDEFAFRTDNDLAQLAVLRAGLGVGGCQVGLADWEPDFVRLLPHEAALGFDTFVVTHEDLRAVRRVRVVFDALVGHLSAYARGELSPWRRTMSVSRQQPTVGDPTFDP